MATTQENVASPQGHNSANNVTTRIPSVADFAMCDSQSTGWEILFESLVGSLFREQVLPAQGSVLDVGAQFGEFSCRLALLDPTREVMAMDPSPSQVEKIRKSRFMQHIAKQSNNIKVVESGLGSEPYEHTITQEDIRMEGGGGFTGFHVGDTFRVETLDRLFFDKGIPLAFAHLDIEGQELDALKGGRRTIQSNWPIFSTEVRVHKNPQYTKDLLDFIDGLGYDSYVIDESCGFPHMDFRNLINIPRRQVSAKLAHSDAFIWGLATETLWRVDSTNIFQTVLPCCELGGSCCPFQSTSDKNCCSERNIRSWMIAQSITKPEATIGWKSSRKVTLQRRQELGRRAEVPTRNTNSTS